MKTIWLAAMMGVAMVGCGDSGDSSSSSSSSTGSGGSGGGSGGSGGSAPAATVVVFAASDSLTDPPQVRVSDVDGKNQKALTTASSKELPTGANDDPAWSPDGKTIAFASGRDFSSQGSGGDVQNPTLRLIYTMKADGTGQKALTGNDPADCTERSPRYSPDGKLVVFSRVCQSDEVSNDTDQLFTVDADGSNQQRLVMGADASNANLEFGTFTPDGSAVLYVSDKDNQSGDLYSADVATHKVSRLTQLKSGIFGAPMVAPDGTIYLVEGSFSDPAATVHSLNKSGGSDKLLFQVPTIKGSKDQDGSAANSDYALSPDGKSFVFSAFFDEETGSRYRVNVSDLDGTNPHSLTDADYNVSHPSLH